MPKWQLLLKSRILALLLIPVLTSIFTFAKPHVARALVGSNLIDLHKCFVSRDVFTLLRAFKVYILPIIEYASCVWSPYHVNLVKLTEYVRRKFTKRLPGYASLSYKDRLSRLGLDSLELRRLRYDLLYLHIK